jgi:hypothetical protein
MRLWNDGNLSRNVLEDAEEARYVRVLQQGVSVTRGFQSINREWRVVEGGE